jgi:hypothetical protein
MNDFFNNEFQETVETAKEFDELIKEMQSKKIIRRDVQRTIQKLELFLCLKFLKKL